MNRLLLALVALIAFVTCSTATVAAEDYRHCTRTSLSNSPMENNGAEVETLDGHIYIVDSIDRIYTMLWLVAMRVIVCEDNSPLPNRYVLLRGDDDAHARRAK